MTKGETVNLYANLKKLGTLRGVKFAYAVAKNTALLDTEVEALKKALEMTEEFKKYDDARVKLAEEYSKKDEKGKPVLLKTTNERGEIVREEYDLAEETKAEWEEKFETLKLEHKEAIDARDAQIQEQNELLKTESTLTFHKIKLADVPVDITSAQMGFIYEIVEE